jgi:hypothetical protein
MKVARLSALRTSRLYPQDIFLVLISVERLSRPQGHSAAEWITSMKNSNDTIGNRSRELPVWSAVPQPLRHHWMVKALSKYTWENSFVRYLFAVAYNICDQ